MSRTLTCTVTVADDVIEKWDAVVAMYCNYILATNDNMLREDEMLGQIIEGLLSSDLLQQLRDAFAQGIAAEKQ